MSYIAKTIIFGSLTAFAVETSVLAHNGRIGHGLPSAVQIAPTLASSGAASMLVVSGALHHFPSAITEAVYPGVADSKVLKNDGQLVLSSLGITST